MFLFKIGGLFVALWNILKYFFFRLYTAVKFAIIDYDSKLQMTKTPKQRFMIWSVIGAITLVVLYFILSISGYYFRKYAHI